jgi:hypothetical protein
LYLSPVAFEKLGFRSLGTEAVTVNASRAMGLVPPVLLGVALTMSGIYWLTKRKRMMAQQEGSDSEQAGVEK